MLESLDNVKQRWRKLSVLSEELISCFAVPVKVRTLFTVQCLDPLHVETKGHAAVIGTVEEVGASHRAQMLVRDQFETNYFGPVNIIKATLPQMRSQKIGHMMILRDISKHASPRTARDIY